MKKTDIAMIILIASVSALIAYFIAHAIFGDIRNETVKVDVAEPITAQIEEPSTKIFNADAINPAVEVQINGTATTGE